MVRDRPSYASFGGVTEFVLRFPPGDCLELHCKHLTYLEGKSFDTYP